MKYFRNRRKIRGGRYRRGLGGKFSPPTDGGVCICVNPNCREEIIHERGKPCYQEVCPKCGSPMVRKYGT